jgi:hypothetical protein
MYMQVHMYMQDDMYMSWGMRLARMASILAPVLTLLDLDLRA